MGKIKDILGKFERWFLWLSVVGTAFWQFIEYIANNAPAK